MFRLRKTTVRHGARGTWSIRSFNGVDTVFLDLLRAGCWSLARESASVERVHAAVMDYIRGIRARCDATGRRIRFLIGLPHISLGEKTDYTLFQCGVDWKELAADGTVDGIVLMAAFLRPGRDVWLETRDVYSHVMRNKGSIEGSGEVMSVVSRACDL